MLASFRQHFFSVSLPKARLLSLVFYAQAKEWTLKFLADIKRTLLQMVVSEKALVYQESQIGRLLFGDIPKGHQREFFNVNETTWIWYESWRDEAGLRRERTIKYDVRSTGIWKYVADRGAEPVSGDELNNFVTATWLYFERVMAEVYRRDPATGLRLPDA